MKQKPLSSTLNLEFRDTFPKETLPLEKTGQLVKSMKVF